MDSILRASAIYLVLMVLFRISGRRSLTDIRTFDLLLLMIIGEATQQALLGDDFSLVNAVLVIITLIVIDVGVPRRRTMDSILRAAALYLVLLVLFRIAGRRSLTDITTFDLLLLMIIGEATQQALLGDDFSLVNAVLVIITLIVIDVGLSLLKLRHPKLDTLIEGSPTLIVEYGRPLHARLAEARLREEDILLAARETQGLERMEQIRFAILEKNGKISIIPDRGD